jgi:hypothetical protein
MPHGESRRRDPVFPAHAREPGGDGAVAGHADADGDEAARAVVRRDVPQAVRRVSQAVQQHHRAARGTVGHEHIGSVPVECPPRGVHRAAVEEAIRRDALGIG